MNKCIKQNFLLVLIGTVLILAIMVLIISAISLNKLSDYSGGTDRDTDITDEITDSTDLVDDVDEVVAGDSGPISVNLQEATFEGLTFVYDANEYFYEIDTEYVGDNGMLWLKERYDHFTADDYDGGAGVRGSVPALLTMTKADSSPDGVERYAIVQGGLGDAMTLEEEELDSKFWSYEYVTFGDLEFLKLVVPDMFEMTTYYFEVDGALYEFKTAYPENQIEVEEILSTIKF